MTDADTHAPEPNTGYLYPLGVASLLSGLLLLAFWVMLVLGEHDLPDVGADASTSRLTLLAACGSFMALLGLGLVIYVQMRSESFGAGRARVRLVLNVALMVVLGALLLGLVNYVFARHELWRVDLTDTQIYTLSDESKQLVKVLEKDIRVVVLLPRGLELNLVDRLVDQYANAGPRLSVEYTNPRNLDPGALREKLEELGLDPDLSEGELFGLVIQALAGTEAGSVPGQSKHVPLSALRQPDPNDPTHRRQVFMGERLISSAIRSVTEGESPQIYFLTGHGERDIADFEEKTSISRLVATLRQRHYRVASLNMLTREKLDVPDDCAVLVVAGPKKALTKDEVIGIKEFLDGGGRAIFLVEAWYRAGLEGTTVFTETGVESLLGEFGIEPLDEAILLMFMDRRLGRRRARPDLYCEDLAMQHPVTQPLRGGRAFFYSSRPLQLRPTPQVDQTALVTTKGWGQGCFSSHDPMRQTQTGETMHQGPFNLVVCAEAAKGARIVAFGDIEFATNQFLGDNRFCNLELFLNAVNWTTHREAQMIGKAHREKSYKLDMSAGTLSALKSLACPGMPFVALAFGLFAFLIRKQG